MPTRTMIFYAATWFVATGLATWALVAAAI